MPQFVIHISTSIDSNTVEMSVFKVIYKFTFLQVDIRTKYWFTACLYLWIIYIPISYDSTLRIWTAYVLWRAIYIPSSWDSNCSRQHKKRRYNLIYIPTSRDSNEFFKNVKLQFIWIYIPTSRDSNDILFVTTKETNCIYIPTSRDSNYDSEGEIIDVTKSFTFLQVVIRTFVAVMAQRDELIYIPSSID